MEGPATSLTGKCSSNQMQMSWTNWKNLDAQDQDLSITGNLLEVQIIRLHLRPCWIWDSAG
jgi:hypothetical protein